MKARQVWSADTAACNCSTVSRPGPCSRESVNTRQTIEDAKFNPHELYTKECALFWWSGSKSRAANVLSQREKICSQSEHRKGLVGVSWRRRFGVAKSRSPP